jgi:hypothetical protein
VEAVEVARDLLGADLFIPVTVRIFGVNNLKMSGTKKEA